MTTKTEKNIATVQGIYAAFGRGDAPAILETISPDVHWEFATSASGVPWLEEGRGRDAVVAFFHTLGGELDFKVFEPITVMAEGDWVVALIRLEAVVKRTGKTLREDCEAHIWRFDAEGRVAAMRHAADTAAHVRALAA